MFLIAAGFLASAQPPSLPLVVSGEVFIDDLEAPAGTVVKVFVGGREASSHTLKEAGDYVLAINGVKEDEGKKLSFTVDGRQVSGIELMWNSGNVLSRTLSVETPDTTVLAEDTKGGKKVVSPSGGRTQAGSSSDGGGTDVYWVLGLGLIVLLAAVFFVSLRKHKA